MDFYEQKTIAETVDILKCDIDQGLCPDDVESRSGFSGPNQIMPKEEAPVSSRIFDLLLRPFTLGMVFSALALAIYGEFFAGGLLLLANGLEIFLNLRARTKSRSVLDIFSELARERVTVRREGELKNIAVSELSLGDIVLLEPGIIVPADMRLIKTSSLFIDESPLTGRPSLSAKDAMFVSSAPLPFSKRQNMAYMGSTVMVGEGEGIVTATARNTEMGQAAYLLEDQERPLSPFEVMLGKLNLPLALFAGGSAILSAAAGLVRQSGLTDSLFLGLSGLISAYPEGIGFVLISALALGASGIVRAGISLNRSGAIPSLGCLSVLCVDKTGTLTKNHVSVNQVYYNGQFFDKADIKFSNCGPLITGFALCSGLEDGAGRAAEGRFERALIEMTETAGVSPSRIENAFPRINALPYKPGHEMATSLHAGAGGENVSFTMGSAEDIISRSVDILKEGEIRPLLDEDMVDIEAAVQKMASQGLDVVTLCTRRGDRNPTEDNLVFVGLAGLSDPLREDAGEMLEAFRQAGIKIVLLSEEERSRALVSAELLGIIENGNSGDLTAEDIEDISDEKLAELAKSVSLYSGITPLLKLRIINALKDAGETVGVTGRGIWDCPSLLASNLGVALADAGQSVRRAADVTIREKGLPALAKAALRARAALENAKTSLRYLFTANIALSIVLIWSAFAGNAAPINPLGILWLNLIALLLPAASFGGQSLIPSKRPKESSSPSSGILGFDFLLSNGIYGLFISFGTLLAYGMGQKIAASDFLIGAEALATARAFAFCAFSFSMLLGIPGAIAKDRSIFTVNPFSNKLAILAFVAGASLQAIIGTVPAISGFFGIRALNSSEWVIVLTISLIPLILHELIFFVNHLVNKLGR